MQKKKTENQNPHQFHIISVSDCGDEVLSYHVLQMPAGPVCPVTSANFIGHNSMDQGGNVMRINLEFHLRHRTPHCHVHILALSLLTNGYGSEGVRRSLQLCYYSQCVLLAKHFRSSRKEH